MSRAARAGRRRASPASWLCFLLWCTWLVALQGRLASGAAAAWAPDLGIALLLALERRLGTGEAVLAALLVAGARLALGADPPAAVLAALLGCVGALRLLGEYAEIDRPGARAVLAGLAAGATAALLALARRARLEVGAEDLASPLAAILGGAFATFVATLVLAPLLARLPGLTPLRARAAR